jgi:O-antigen/teichoic acid export membrane protein
VGLIAFPWVASRPEQADARRTMWSLVWLTTGIAVILVAVLCALAHWLVPFFFGGDFADAVRVTYIVLPGMIFLSGRRVLSEGLKGRGYPLAGTLGELVSLAWVALALAVFVPLWGIYGAAVALSSSYVLSLLLLVALTARYGELEWASRTLLSLPRDLLQTVKGAGLPAEVELQEADRPTPVS